MNQQQLKNILNELGSLCNELDMQVTDDKLLEESVKIYNSENITQSKKDNIQTFNSSKIKSQTSNAKSEGQGNKTLPPSPLQLKHLLRNKQYFESKGIDIDKLSKNEATALLKELWDGNI